MPTTLQSNTAALAICVVAWAPVHVVHAEQTGVAREQKGTVANPTAAQLGQGWAALGQGRGAAALAAARQVLDADPANHDALSLGVAALTTGGSGTAAALDLYEEWLKASTHEDLFPLQTIARSVLAALSTHKDSRVRTAALVARIQAGDRDAAEALQREGQSGNAPVEVDAALAAAGEAAAVERLERRVTGGGTGDKSAAIQALVEARAPGSSKAIAQALKDPVPPSRISAATALGELGAVEAVPALKAALKDSDPAVRHMATIALARLGDPAGGDVLQTLANSPIGELRLLAARIAAVQNPGGDWATAATALLKDPDPLTRLEAAELLLRSGRQEDATGAIDAALNDPTPFLRTRAARILGSTGTLFGHDLVKIRRMLRDPLTDVRLEGAAALLRFGSDRQ